MQNGAVTLEGHLLVSNKTKHIHTINSDVPWYLSKGFENLCPKTWKWIITAALFLIAQTWKQPRYPSVGEWIDKLVCPYSGILFSTKNKGEKHLNHENYQTMKRHGKILDRYYLVKKKPIWKGYIIYDSNCMTFQKRQNYGDSKENQWFSRVGRVGEERNR